MNVYVESNENQPCKTRFHLFQIETKALDFHQTARNRIDILDNVWVTPLPPKRRSIAIKGGLKLC